MSDSNTPKVAEVKKLDSGKLAVRWEGKKKFSVIEDEVMAQYLIFSMVKKEGGNDVQG